MAKHFGVKRQLQSPFHFGVNSEHYSQQVERRLKLAFYVETLRYRCCLILFYFIV